MVLVFIGCTRQQRHGADAEFAQLGAGWQVGMHSFQIDVSAARKWLAAEQGFVEVDQHAAPAFEDRANQLLRLEFAGGGPVSILFA